MNTQFTKYIIEDALSAATYKMLQNKSVTKLASKQSLIEISAYVGSSLVYRQFLQKYVLSVTGGSPVGSVTDFLIEVITISLVDYVISLYVLGQKKPMMDVVIDTINSRAFSTLLNKLNLM